MNSSPIQIIEENVIAYYRDLTQLLGGQFIEQDHLVWFTTGRRSLLRFNGVLRFLVSPENLDALAGPVLAHFRSNRLPFFWAEYPPGAVPGLGRFLNTHGIPLGAKDMPAMQRGLDELPPPILPAEFEITAVQTPEDRADWLAVLMQGFAEPEEARADFQAYLNHSLTWPHSAWKHFLARWQGEPCAISTLLCAKLAAGIYHVTTLPAYRGRGLGKALTLAAMRAAREAGYSTAVLFATQDGYPLYQRLGFETVVTADLYAWNGEPG